MTTTNPRVISFYAGVCAVLVTTVSLLLAQDRPPTDIDRAKAVQTFDAVYGAKLKAAVATPGSGDDIDLANELIKVARDSTGDLALLSVLCDRAADLASPHAAGVGAADDALDLLDQQVPSQSPSMLERRIEIRQRQFNSLTGEPKSKAGEKLMDAYMAMAWGLKAASDFDKAAASCDAALRVAGLVRSLRQDEIRNELVLLRADQQRAARVVQLEGRLLRNARDEAAVTELLRLLVIEQDNPAAALGYARLSSDVLWKTNVPLAAKSVSDLSEKDVLALGDWYSELATKATGDAKKRLSKRAKGYYDRFLVLHSVPDLLRKRVEVAAKSIEAQVDSKKRLTVLEPVKHTIWLKPEPHVSADRIWAHPHHNQSSVIEYNLGGNWTTLAGSAVLSNKGPTQGTLVFRIVGDGKDLWKSQPLVKVKQPTSQDFSVSVKGVRSLQLVVDCKGDATHAWTSWDNVFIDTAEPKGSSNGATQEDVPTLGSAKTITLGPGGGVTMKFVRIEAGEFPTGSDTKLKVDRIAKGFYMGETEVTQGQWKAVMGTMPWKGQKPVKEGDTYPATHVSWNDAQEFLQKVARSTRRKVRLPTEAEWEYACRAGTKTAYGFGDSDRELGDHAWYGPKSGNTRTEPYAHQVKAKKPNPWGLHDMLGNVWEWCEDKNDDGTRVLRGGSWTNEPVNCRPSARNSAPPDRRHYSDGFRVVMDFE